MLTTTSPGRKLIATTKISDERTSVELPTTFHGEVIVGRVAVQNDSDAPVTLSKIKTSCGCTKVRIGDKKVLVPSDTLNLDFEINQNRVGPYSVTLTVFNGDKSHETKLRGKNFRRIEVLEAKIKPSDDGLKFRLGVNDGTINPSEIRVAGGEATKV